MVNRRVAGSSAAKPVTGQPRHRVVFVRERRPRYERNLPGSARPGV